MKFKIGVLFLCTVAATVIISGCKGSSSSADSLSDNSAADTSATEQVLVSEPDPTDETADVTFDESKVSLLYGWKKAFFDLITNKFPNSENDFALIEVDDNIPELYFFDCDDREHYFAYYDGTSAQYSTLSISSYAEHGGLIISEGGDFLNPNYSIYSFSNGSMILLDTASWNMGGSYYWNGETVTARDYEARFKQYEDVADCRPEFCSKQDVLNQLFDY